MLRYLLLLFLLLAIAECVALYWLATHIGLLATIGLLLVAGIAGSALVRRQGILAADRLHEELERGVMPADALFDGVLILFAAVLLIVPGILTDVAAIALLVPPSRAVVKQLLRRSLARGGMNTTTWTDPSATRDRIIDVQVTEIRTSEAAQLDD